MKLSQLISESSSLPLWEFTYPEYMHDPTPKVMVLGTYVNKSTGNNLLMGINVRLLDTQKALQLISMIDDLATIKDGRTRARYLRNKASQIFNKAYRTYDLSKVTILSKSTVNSKGPSKTKKQEIIPTTTPTTTPKSTNNIQPTDKVPTIDKDLAKTKIEPIKSTPTTKKFVPLPKPEHLQPLGDNDPLAYDTEPSIDPAFKQVDNTKSTGETNVGNTQKISPQAERSTRRLDTLPKRSNEKIQQPNGTIPDLEDEEYRSI